MPGNLNLSSTQALCTHDLCILHMFHKQHCFYTLPDICHHHSTHYLNNPHPQDTPQACSNQFLKASHRQDQLGIGILHQSKELQ